MAKISIFGLRLVWKLEIFSKSIIFLNFYIKKDKIWDFLIQNLENLKKSRKSLIFLKNLSFQSILVKIWPKSIIFQVISKNKDFSSLTQNWWFFQIFGENDDFSKFGQNLWLFKFSFFVSCVTIGTSNAKKLKFLHLFFRIQKTSITCYPAQLPILSNR